MRAVPVETKLSCRGEIQADLKIGERFDTPGNIARLARQAMSGW